MSNAQRTPLSGPNSSVVPIMRDKKKEHIDVSLWSAAVADKSHELQRPHTAMAQRISSPSHRPPLRRETAATSPDPSLLWCDESDDASRASSSNATQRSHHRMDHLSFTTAAFHYALSTPSIVSLMEESRRRKHIRLKIESLEKSEVFYRERAERTWLIGFWFMWVYHTSLLIQGSEQVALVEQELGKVAEVRVTAGGDRRIGRPSSASRKRAMVRQDLAKSLERINANAHLLERFYCWKLRSVERRVSEPHHLHRHHQEDRSMQRPSQESSPIAKVEEISLICSHQTIETADEVGHQLGASIATERPSTAPADLDYSSRGVPLVVRRLEESLSRQNSPSESAATATLFAPPPPLTSYNATSDESISPQHHDDLSGVTLQLHGRSSSAANTTLSFGESLITSTRSNIADDLLAAHTAKLLKYVSLVEVIRRKEFLTNVLNFVACRNDEMRLRVLELHGEHLCNVFAQFAITLLETSGRTLIHVDESCNVVDIMLEYKMWRKTSAAEATVSSSNSNVPRGTVVSRLSSKVQDGLNFWMERKISDLQRIGRAFLDRLAAHRLHVVAARQTRCCALLQRLGRGGCARRRMGLQLRFWSVDSHIRSDLWQRFEAKSRSIMAECLEATAKIAAAVIPTPTSHHHSNDAPLEEFNLHDETATSSGKVYSSVSNPSGRSTVDLTLTPIGASTSGHVGTTMVDSAQLNEAAVLLQRVSRGYLHGRLKARGYRTFWILDEEVRSGLWSAYCKTLFHLAGDLAAELRSVEETAVRRQEEVGRATLLQRCGRGYRARHHYEFLKQFWTLDTTIRADAFQSWERRWFYLTCVLAPRERLEISEAALRQLVVMLQESAMEGEIKAVFHELQQRLLLSERISVEQRPLDGDEGVRPDNGDDEDSSSVSGDGSTVDVSSDEGDAPAARATNNDEDADSEEGDEETISVSSDDEPQEQPPHSLAIHNGDDEGVVESPPTESRIRRATQAPTTPLLITPDSTVFEFVALEQRERQECEQMELEALGSLMKREAAEKLSVLDDGSDTASTVDDDDAEDGDDEKAEKAVEEDSDRNAPMPPFENDAVDLATPARSDTTHEPRGSTQSFRSVLESARQQRRGKPVRPAPRKFKGLKKIGARSPNRGNEGTLNDSTSSDASFTSSTSHDSDSSVSVSSTSIDVTTDEDTGKDDEESMLDMARPSVKSVREIYMILFAQQVQKLVGEEEASRAVIVHESYGKKLALISAQEYLARFAVIVQKHNVFHRKMFDLSRKLRDMVSMQRREDEQIREPAVTASPSMMTVTPSLSTAAILSGQSTSVSTTFPAAGTPSHLVVPKGGVVRRKNNNNSPSKDLSGKDSVVYPEVPPPASHDTVLEAPGAPSALPAPDKSSLATSQQDLQGSGTSQSEGRSSSKDRGKVRKLLKSVHLTEEQLRAASNQRWV